MSIQEYRATAATVGPQETSSTNPPAEVSNPTRKRYADITELQGFFGSTRDVMLSKHFDPSKKSDKSLGKFQEYSVVLRRTIEENTGKELGIALEIQSERLRDTFRSIIPHTYDEVDLYANPIRISRPYEILFFNQSKIEEYVKDETNPTEVREGMDLIGAFTRENKDLQVIRERYSSLMQRQMIISPILWTLYPPEEVCVFNLHRVMECWVPRTVTFDRNNDEWIVSCYTTDFDGTNIRRVIKQLKIASFRGEMAITSLPLVPAREEFIPDWELERDVMIERGKQFLKLPEASHMSYCGSLWTPIANGRGKPRLHDAEPPTLEINEQVVVDSPLYLEQHPWERHEEFTRTSTNIRSRRQRLRRTSTSLSTATFRSLIANEQNEPSELQDSEENLLLLPARIHVFALRQKTWGWVLIENLTNIEWKEESEAFNSLQLDEKKKDLVLTLISGQCSDMRSSFDDVIQGKGRGLFFLFHGLPGLGKTLTCEGVAEQARRPLYQVSGGELSTDVGTMEERLKSIFRVGKKWNAIVLLDEADVLVAQRKDDNLGRNAVVAIFLRMLEYYEGILFLTTNRFSGLDDAFKNRIHITLQFPQLNPGARERIWRNILQANASHVTLDQSWTNEAYEALSRVPINGRSIKNLLGTAVCYAFAKSPATSQRTVLAVSHVNTVMQINLAGEADEGDDEEDERDRKAKKAKQMEKALNDLNRLNAQVTSRAMQAGEGVRR